MDTDTLPYYLVLFAIAVPALAEHARKPTAGWLLTYLVLVFFVGLRYQVGSDWEGYLALARLVEDRSLAEVLQIGDPLFYLVLWSSVHLGFDVYGANLVTSGIFLLGLFSYCRRMPNPWLALYSALPFLVIVVGMSANRQAAAIGVTLYLLASWETSSTLRRLVVLAIAVGFHTSALIFMLLFVIDSKLSRLRKILATIAVLAATAYFASSSSTIERYTESYIDDTDINVAAGALQQILLNAIPGLFLLLRRRKFAPRILQPNFVMPMALFAVLLVPLAFLYSVAASRVSFYLFPVSISLLSAIPSVSRDGRTRGFLRYTVVLYGMGLLAAWLMLANHAYNHKPYGNVLFL